MSNRRDYYFRQLVTEAELDEGFADLEDADHALMQDMGVVGVLYGLGVAQAVVPNLTVTVAGPGAAYDSSGQRVFVASNQSVDVSKDSNNVSTAVSTSGKEKKISVFVQFARALSDPRTDGNGAQVFFLRAESFQFVVLQGTEANTGTSTAPSTPAGAVRLADITRAFGQTSIVNANINTAARDDALFIGGTPQSIRRGRTKDAIGDLLALYNQLVTGTGPDSVAAVNVSYAGGAAWVDGTTNPATTAEAQFDKMITDLKSAGMPALVAGGAFGTYGAVDPTLPNASSFDAGGPDSLARVLLSYRIAINELDQHGATSPVGSDMVGTFSTTTGRWTVNDVSHALLACDQNLRHILSGPDNDATFTEQDFDFLIAPASITNNWTYSLDHTNASGKKVLVVCCLSTAHSINIKDGVGGSTILSLTNVSTAVNGAMFWWTGSAWATIFSGRVP